MAHVSHDLRDVMNRREQGLDEDWSEDALSAEEEIEEDRDLLHQIAEAVGSITRGKGVAHEDIMKATSTGGRGLPSHTCHMHAWHMHHEGDLGRWEGPS